MFGFGNDNKDQLEENMDEIKSMIENGESLQQGQQDNQPEQEQQGGQQQVQQQPEQEMSEDFDDLDTGAEGFDQEQDQFSDEDVEDFEKNLEKELGKQDQPSEGFQGTDDSQQFQGQSQQEPATGSEPRGNERPQQPQRPQQENRGRQQNMGRRESQEEQITSDRVSDGPTNSGRNNRSQGSVNASIPEPAKTRELNVPDIDKGPLFIRRQKFEYASQLIQEMRYLAEQVENTVNDIEADLQRDRETESQVREILHEFEEDRSEVERIVSPDKE